MGSRPRLHVCRHSVARVCDGEAEDRSRGCKSTGKSEKQRTDGNLRTFEQSNEIWLLRVRERRFRSRGLKPTAMDVSPLRGYVAGIATHKNDIFIEKI